MPLLAAHHRLPACPSRVLVAGTSGSGKTTLAGLIASELGCPHVEIDSLFHGPNWVPREAFMDDVRQLAATPAWTTEWQYGPARSVLAERADAMIWLDLPRSLVMRRIARRTLLRRIHRQRLWNGNIEPPLWTFFTNRDHIVRWAWRTYPRNRERMRELLDERPDLVIVQLRSQQQVDSWFGGPFRAAAGTP